MIAERSLTVGVYIDSLSPEFDLNIVSSGIGMVGNHAPLKLLDAEKIYLPPTGSFDYLNVDRLGWPELDGDMTIILTDRQLVKEEHLRADGSVRRGQKVNGGDLIGFSYLLDRQRSQRIALVDAAHTTKADVIVAHEACHLVGITIQSPVNDHCSDDSCVMTSVIDEDISNWDFCENCGPEITSKSEELLAAKASSFVLSRLVRSFCR
jgi:hypothetical protein